MELAQASLFEIPMWTAQLDSVVPFHDDMTREVEALIDSSSDNSFLAHQTPSDPFFLPSRGWQLLERLCNGAYSDLAKLFCRQRAGEFHLRRWAIRLGRLNENDKARLAQDAVHNHLPALFSSIYYLRVPEEFSDNCKGGTLFFNPIGNLMDLMSPRTKTVAPKEGRLVIFPSFLDHTPVPIGWDAEETARIVISSDIFYVSGEAVRNAVLKAEPARG